MSSRNGGQGLVSGNSVLQRSSEIQYVIGEVVKKRYRKRLDELNLHCTQHSGVIFTQWRHDRF